MKPSTANKLAKMNRRRDRAIGWMKCREWVRVSLLTIWDIDNRFDEIAAYVKANKKVKGHRIRMVYGDLWFENPSDCVIFKLKFL